MPIALKVWPNAIFYLDRLGLFDVYDYKLKNIKLKYILKNKICLRRIG